MIYEAQVLRNHANAAKDGFVLVSATCCTQAAEKIEALQSEIDEATARRERLLKFIDNFYSSYDLQRHVFHGYGNQGISITPADLTDECLERFASQLIRDFWTSKRYVRQNRAIYAKRKVA